MSLHRLEHGGQQVEPAGRQSQVTKRRPVRLDLEPVAGEIRRVERHPRRALRRGGDGLLVELLFALFSKAQFAQPAEGGPTYGIVGDVHECGADAELARKALRAGPRLVRQRSQHLRRPEDVQQVARLQAGGKHGAAGVRGAELDRQARRNA